MVCPIYRGVGPSRNNAALVPTPPCSASAPNVSARGDAAMRGPPPQPVGCNRAEWRVGTRKLVGLLLPARLLAVLLPVEIERSTVLLGRLVQALLALLRWSIVLPMVTAPLGPWLLFSLLYPATFWLLPVSGLAAAASRPFLLLRVASFLSTSLTGSRVAPPAEEGVPIVQFARTLPLPLLAGLLLRLFPLLIEQRRGRLTPGVSGGRLRQLLRPSPLPVVAPVARVSPPLRVGSLLLPAP